MYKNHRFRCPISQILSSFIDMQCILQQPFSSHNCQFLITPYSHVHSNLNVLQRNRQVSHVTWTTNTTLLSLIIRFRFALILSMCIYCKSHTRSMHVLVFVCNMHGRLNGNLYGNGQYEVTEEQWKINKLH